MSTFAVTYRTISKVWNHPNADKLDLAQVDGMSYQFVVGRDNYKVGDGVLYFPLDAVLPQWIVERLGLVGRLSGKEKNRIKTVRLRGEISQGIVANPDLFVDHPDKYPSVDRVMGIKDGFGFSGIAPDVLTKHLGVTKYEPPPIFSKAGNLVRMPEEVGVYDIEGADQFPEIIDILMDQKVCITEKIEGTNFWISCERKSGFKEPEILTNALGQRCYDVLNMSIVFGQRHHQIEPIAGAEHDFWRIAKDSGLTMAIQCMVADNFPGKRVTLRGEFAGPGVQGNIYKLPTNKIYIFDIKVGDEYLAPDQFFNVCKMHGVLTPPVIAIDMTLRDWLRGQTIRQASNGQSIIACVPKVLREGVVIKPMAEQRHQKIGRLFIKQRSPEYLAENDL